MKPYQSKFIVTDEASLKNQAQANNNSTPVTCMC